MRIKEQSYYWFPIAGDANVGSGVGTLKGKGLGKDYQMGGTYPYDNYLSDDLDDPDDEEPEDFFLDALGSSDAVKKFAKRTRRNYVNPDPGGVGVGKRYDMRSTSTNQRFDIATLAEDISTRKGDSLYGSISPIPFKNLYKKFSGPAVGGVSLAMSYTLAPFGRHAAGIGTQYGSSRPSALLDDVLDDAMSDEGDNIMNMLDDQEGDRMHRFTDIRDPDQVSLSRTRKNVKRAHQRSRE